MSGSPPVFAAVGHPNKGKSSIVATLAADDSVRIAAEPGTTTRCQRYPMQVDGQVLYELVDTPGFQRARAALAWMRERETDAAAHPEVVEAFVEAHRGTGAFPDECELLTPLLQGAGILYVVDGSVPYGPEYEAEMEILRWTGRPSLALINPIGGDAHLEEWRRALAQYFKIVRVFDALAADFDARLELLRGFGQLSEEWREPLDRAVRVLEEERGRLHARVARALAALIEDVLSATRERRLGSEADFEDYRAELERDWREAIRQRERRARREVERLYGHRGIEREEAVVDPTDPLHGDLFSTDSWYLWGLNRRQLVATGAAGGAVLGGAVDVGLGGSSLLLGSAVGAALGGAGAWWSSGRLTRTRVLSLPLGGRVLRCGPVQSPNFPWVLLGRALHHHARIAGRSHADRSALSLGDSPPAQSWVETLEPARRRELERLFRDLQRGEPVREELARCLVPWVASGAGPLARVPVTGRD